MIGAGLGGLCCAALLAKYGVQVHLACAALRLACLKAISGRQGHELMHSKEHVQDYHGLPGVIIWLQSYDAGVLPAPGFEHMGAVMQVTVVESHAIPGGAAHAWVQNGYHFESGPSLYSGMAAKCAPTLCFSKHSAP